MTLLKKVGIWLGVLGPTCLGAWWLASHLLVTKAEAADHLKDGHPALVERMNAQEKGLERVETALQSINQTLLDRLPARK